MAACGAGAAAAANRRPLGAADDPQGRSWIAGFRRKLQESGWKDGSDLHVDVRWGGADIEHIRAGAADLVSSRPDVILVYAIRVLNAMRQATREIPIVFIATSDPVGLGFIESLARPGGNLTGFMLYEVSVAGKLVELLKEMAPRLQGRPCCSTRRTSAQAATSSRSKRLRSLSVSLRSGFPCAHARRRGDAIDAFVREPNGISLLPTDVTTIVHRDLIVALAARHRLPAIYSFRADVASGGLMCCSPDTTDLFRRGFLRRAHPQG